MRSAGPVRGSTAGRARRGDGAQRVQRAPLPPRRARGVRLPRQESLRGGAAHAGGPAPPHPRGLAGRASTWGTATTTRTRGPSRSPPTIPAGAPTAPSSASPPRRSSSSSHRRPSLCARHRSARRRAFRRRRRRRAGRPLVQQQGRVDDARLRRRPPSTAPTSGSWALAIPRPSRCAAGTAAARGRRRSRSRPAATPGTTSPASISSSCTAAGSTSRRRTAGAGCSLARRSSTAPSWTDGPNLRPLPNTGASRWRSGARSSYFGARGVMAFDGQAVRLARPPQTRIHDLVVADGVLYVLDGREVLGTRISRGGFLWPPRPRARRASAYSTAISTQAPWSPSCFATAGPSVPLALRGLDWAHTPPTGGRGRASRRKWRTVSSSSTATRFTGRPAM